MELDLLLDLASLAIPDDGGLVDGATKQQVALAVPLQAEDGALVRHEHLL